ncbi:MAG TPA: UDP-N-acetylglucosamine 1-carboxyvinyltransferase [Pyrinomonadaceae bacterium]|nr:UDP-N-acetylglucosamine 1-carboxyvinyltransferase [Pyrinomonadaceae bacterium]
MEKLRIRGGNPIRGRVAISGAKNSALPCMAAAILTSETVTLHNLPYVRDIITMRRLLEDIGAHVLTPELRTHKISAAHIEVMAAPYELVKTMRASVLALGPLLTRFGKARVSLPGGCAIGARPIDLHLTALTKMGAEVFLEAGDVVARSPDEGLRGAEITFDKISVTGTENLMMAATLARGTTTIHNAAREPEVRDLAELLNKMGARVRGAGTPSIQIEGVEALGSAQHTIIPDRIETGTFIAAAAITKGELEIRDCNPEHCNRIIGKLREVGVEIEEVNQSTLYARCGSRGLHAGDLTTEAYPAFPTDMQAQFMTLMTQANGRSTIRETIFENRFMHASELQRMGARIQVNHDTAVVDGPNRLVGARVQASDLRASASLVLAGLAAEGETIIDRVYHIDRGYEKIETKLKDVGADIERLRDSVTAPLTEPDAANA